MDGADILIFSRNLTRPHGKGEITVYISETRTRAYRRGTQRAPNLGFKQVGRFQAETPNYTYIAVIGILFLRSVSAKIHPGAFEAQPVWGAMARRMPSPPQLVDRHLLNRLRGTASHSCPIRTPLLYIERAAARRLLSWALPSLPSLRFLVLGLATFTLRAQLPLCLGPLSQSNRSTFPKNSQTQHHLLFCASEDLWGYEVYTGRQLQPTWKCLQRRLKSDKEAEWDSQREPASHSAFPMFKSPQFRNTIFFNLQRSTFVLRYMIQLNIFPGAWIGQSRSDVAQPSGPTEKLPIYCQAHGSKWRS